MPITSFFLIGIFFAFFLAQVVVFIAHGGILICFNKDQCQSKVLLDTRKENQCKV